MEIDRIQDNNWRARSLHELRLFFTALQFYTRLPIPRWVGFDLQLQRNASRYFPAVGIVVALVTIVVFALSSLLWTKSIAVLLSTMAGILLTGAMHEDGFADTCDGFGGGATPERVIEIMRDSRLGTYGVIGMGLTCLTLSSLPAPVVVTALLVAHPLSRLAAISVVRWLDYAKISGKAKPMAQQISDRDLTIAGLITLLPIAIFGVTDVMPWYGIAAGILPAAGAFWWLMHLFKRRLGGYTGDCLGAVQQVTEVAFYLGVLAVVPR
jgi:adenosylcobinamide-GDP ribazoletransferase